MNPVIRWLCLALAVAELANSAEMPSLFFFKNIIAPDTAISETASLIIDSDIYQRTNDSFSDICLYDSVNTEIPFLIRPIVSRDTDTVINIINLRMENTIELPDKRMTLVFTRSDNDSVPSGLSIETPLENFEQNVSVFGSDDKTTWMILAEKQPIFDYAQFADVRNTDVTFKKQTHRFYKIVFDNVHQIKQSPFSRIVSETEGGTIRTKYTTFVEQQQKFRLDRISFYGFGQVIHNGKQNEFDYPLTIHKTVSNSIKKTTEVILKSKREPLTKILFTVKDVNFKRNVTLEGTNDTTENLQWQHLTSSELYSIQAGIFSKTFLEIHLDTPCRYSTYRLTINNDDNGPITISSVRTKGYAHELVFFHRNIRTFRLFYGSNDTSLRIPEYDIASVFEKAPNIATSYWNADSQHVNVLATGKKVQKDTKYILFATLSLLVIVLVGILIVTVKKIETPQSSADGEERYGAH